MTSRAGIRLYIDAPLDEGAAIVMSDAHAHYLRNVMRQEPGGTVQLFNGRDGEWRARIDRLDKRGGEFAIESQTRPQVLEAGPWLAIAPIKRARIEMIVEKATELGAARFLPVVTTRTNSERVNRERLGAIATEAAEQCGRLTVPTIAETQSLQQMLDDRPKNCKLYVLDETGAGAPVAKKFAAHPNDAQAVLVIGPEGGFDQSELDAMRILPFVNALDLGRRILRAETAALAALACYQAIAGDWT